MYKIIKSYCENNSNNIGLFLVDMPTGFGKTYSVLKYIFDACQDKKNKNRKFFFITPLKKNLPNNELEEFFRKNDRLKEFNKKVLVIKSNADMALENYDGLTNLIPDDIKKTDEYKNFSQRVSILNQYEEDNNSQIYKILKDDFRKNLEPAFRRLIQNILKGKFPDKKSRLDAIKNDRDWKWLGSLYPTVFTDDYQIYFMSMDKFILKNSTIVEPSYMFFDSKIIENAVIFIDEFDSTKETILQSIIKNTLDDKIDFIEMFKTIYSAMKTNELPEIYTVHSRKENYKYKDNDLHKIIDNTLKIAEEIYKKYSVQFNYRTDNKYDLKENFMFQDYHYHSVIDGNKKYIFYVTDKNKKLNLIDFSVKEPEEYCNNIQSVISDIKGFMSWFQLAINILAINYKQLKDERRKNGEDEFTWENALRTVISEFHLNRYYTDYLVSQIILNSYRKKNNDFSDSQFDLSVYENGFRYYCFENDATHDMQSKIMMCSFNNTPEKMLLRFCEKAKVIGISATATLPTVTGNFDLEYLRHKMGNRFCNISENDLRRLKNDFIESQKGYHNQIKIHSELIEITDYSLQTWQNIVCDNEVAEFIYNKLEYEVYENNKNNYNKERYARIATAFKAFLAHDDIYSFLCFLTKFPRDNNKQLDKKILKEIFDYIQKCNFPDLTYDVEFIYSEEYDKTKEKLIKRLADGEKIFVISTYQTIGAGQNLQYLIPENLKGKLINSNNFPPRNEKDFDAIYIDKPTNIIVNMTDDWEKENFTKYIFQMEFLQESYELSTFDTWQQIKKAFECYSRSSKPYGDYAKIYDCESVKMHATRIIIQAIGRICRTNQKNENIYIFADSRIKDIINPDIAEKGLFNFEFKSLCEKICETNEKYSLSDNMKNKAETISNRASRHIDNIRNHNKWNDKTMLEWKILRDFVLKFPTISG